ncbi:MAG: hypothetical protein PHU23_08675 [Dehalococcoidales bacterium]|nr:hypothetical protein [Dehalococcoidales bacterium]
MVTVTAPAPLNGDNSKAQGHCSRCGKVWTLKERQGVCQWCHKPASCITATSKPRHIKSRSNGRLKQDDHNGNGYNQLNEPYLTYYNIALPFANSVPDREDLLHTIIMTLADVERNNGHKPFTRAVMYRIASITKARYWREHYKHTNGLTCGNCSKTQRRKCREDNLYGNCPKALKIESLNQPIIDSEGNTTEFGELIADPESLDPDIWERESLWQIGYKPRLVDIALKLHKGEALAIADRKYLCKYRHQEQKRLIGG